MSLEPRPELEQVLASCPVDTHDCVRVADRGGGEPDRCACVDDFLIPHVHAAHLGLREQTAQHSDPRGTSGADDLDLLGTGECRQPAAGDPDSVAGHLGDRPVRIPDHQLGSRGVVPGDLEHAVRPDPDLRIAQARDALGVEATGIRLLDDEVRVTERVPFGESHPQPPRSGGTRPR